MSAVGNWRGAAFGAVLALGGLIQTAGAADRPTPMIGPDATSFTIDNGLEVVVIPDHRAPVVTHMIYYKVGSSDEDPGKSGLAHFLEHLMFKGTKTHPEGEFSRVISEIGGDENAFTTSDYTAYFQRVAKEHLKLMMSYEADRMANLVLTDENVLPERKVVLEEQNMRVGAEPASQLSIAMDAAMYMHHPYSIPVIGWREEIETLNREDALAFYDRFYTPNNAIVVVAGDVTVDEVKAAVADTYAKVPRRADPPRRSRAAPQMLDVQRSVSHADPKVAQESVQVAWLVPSYRLAEPGEAEAFDVLAEALGGGSASLLYRDLVIDQKVATSVGAYYQGDAYDLGQFMIYAVPREGVALETAQAALLASLKSAVDSRLSLEELSRAKNRLEADTIFAQDSQSTLARIFGGSLITGDTLDEVKNWPSRIRAVPLDAVKAAAGLLAPETATTGYLRKSPAAARS